MSLLLDKPEYSTPFGGLLNALPSFEYRNFLYTVLKIAPVLYLFAPVTTKDDAQWWRSDTEVVSSVAAIISQIVGENIPHHKEHLISWLTGSSGAGLGDGIAIRRAVIAVLSRDKTDIETVLDKSLQQFGDQLYIKHTPTLQQDGILFPYSCKTCTNTGKSIHRSCFSLPATFIEKPLFIYR